MEALANVWNDDVKREEEMWDTIYENYSKLFTNLYKMLIGMYNYSRSDAVLLAEKLFNQKTEDADIMYNLRAKQLKFAQSKTNNLGAIVVTTLIHLDNNKFYSNDQLEAAKNALTNLITHYEQRGEEAKQGLDNAVKNLDNSLALVKDGIAEELLKQLLGDAPSTSETSSPQQGGRPSRKRSNKNNATVPAIVAGVATALATVGAFLVVIVR